MAAEKLNKLSKYLALYAITVQKFKNSNFVTPYFLAAERMHETAVLRQSPRFSEKR